VKAALDARFRPRRFSGRPRFALMFPIERARASTTEGAAMEAYRYLTGKDDATFCHRVTEALNKGWQLYGDPTLTFDAKKGEVICGQAIIKEVRERAYSAEMDLAKL
jgi:hypothetical protein